MKLFVTIGCSLSRSFPLPRRIDREHSLALRRKLALPQMLPQLWPFCFNGTKSFVGALNHENFPAQNTCTCTYRVVAEDFYVPFVQGCC